MTRGAATVAAQAVAKPTDAVKEIKKEMAKLGKWRNLHRRGDAWMAAEQARAVLDAIGETVTDPVQGTALVMEFYKTDGRVFDATDDSNGEIGPVYKVDALELFVGYAKRHPNPTKLAHEVLALQADDGYGVRDALIEGASEYLPAAVIDQMIATLLTPWEQALQALPKRTDDRYVFVRLPGELLLQLLARQRRNAALFERLSLARSLEPNGFLCTKIAEVYLLANEPKRAKAWLARVTKDDVGCDEADELRIQVAIALGDPKARDAAAVRTFRRERSMETFAELVAVVGEAKRAALLASERAAILKSRQLRSEEVAFLCDMGFVDDAEAHLLKHAKQLSGHDYEVLPALAKTMKSLQRSLAATVIWRALLDYILQGARLKAYGHGRKYLAALDALAPSITDWRGVTPHGKYRAALVATHARKTSFWGQ